jgi:hypothetical protein
MWKTRIFLSHPLGDTPTYGAWGQTLGPSPSGAFYALVAGVDPHHPLGGTPIYGAWGQTLGPNPSGGFLSL